jgi:hypothetical protein
VLEHCGLIDPTDLEQAIAVGTYGQLERVLRGWSPQRAVDVALVEGGVGNSDNLALIRQVRQRTRLLVSFGDCAITANVPGLRNPLAGPAAVLDRSYLELAGGPAAGRAAADGGGGDDPLRLRGLRPPAQRPPRGCCTSCASPRAPG